MRQSTIFLLAAVALTVLPSAAPAAETIPWETNLQEAAQKAAQTNRLLLVHFGATWCKPCMNLEKTVFQTPGVGDALAQYYVPVKVDFDDYKQFATQYGVTNIPCDLVLTPQGMPLSKSVSPAKAEQYVAQLTQVAMKAAENAAQIAAAQGLAPPANTSAPTDPRYGTNASAPATNYSNQSASLTSGATPAAPVNNTASANNAPVNNTVGDRYSNYQSQAAPTYDQQATQPAGQPMPNNYAGDRYANYGAGAATSKSGQANTPAESPLPSNTQPSYGSQVGSPAGDRYANVTPSSPSGPAMTVPSEPGASAGSASGIAPEGMEAAPQIPAGNPPLGLEGFCPVRLVDESLETGKWVRGDSRYGARHEGRTYLFAGPDEQKKFLESPDRYAPVMAGYDVVEYLETGRMIDGARAFGVYYEGDSRVYLFSSATSRDKFEKDANRYVTMLRQVSRPAAGGTIQR